MSTRYMIQRLAIPGVLAAVSMAFASAAQAGSHSGQAVSKIEDLPVRSGNWSAAEIAKGREQLVAAFDAAWIRIIASGRDQQALAKYPENKPGAANSYIVRLADCLPQPEIAPWPEKPVGMFKDILDTGVIRQLVQGGRARDAAEHFLVLLRHQPGLSGHGDRGHRQTLRRQFEG